MASKSSEENEDSGADVHDREFELLAMLYCFGEKYQDVRFKNTVIDAILAKQNIKYEGGRWYPTDKAVDIIYQGTSSGSPARKLMVAIHTRHGSNEWFEQEVNNHEFLIDLGKSFYKVRSNCSCGAFEGADPEDGNEEEEEEEEDDEGVEEVYTHSLYHELEKPEE